jgi:2-dehydro-3-deoxygluconokinase
VAEVARLVDVVTLGETMVALVPEGRGPLRLARRFRRHIAGAESNVAIGVTRLGHPARWLGRVGDDAFGTVILETLALEGVDTRWAVRDPGAPTGLLFKERPRTGDSSSLYYRRGSAASLQDADQIDPAAFTGARWLHLTGITPALGPGPRRAAARALDLARSGGLAVSFDPNYRAALWGRAEAAGALRPLAEQADVLVFSPLEGEILYGAGTVEALAARALAVGRATLVAVKDGVRGAVLFPAAGSPVAIAPHPVRAVDTTGAGDAFVSGLLAGLLDGMPLHRAGRLAALCGALACTVLGDWEGVPRRAEAEAWLAGGEH